MTSSFGSTPVYLPATNLGFLTIFYSQDEFGEIKRGLKACEDISGYSRLFVTRLFVKTLKANLHQFSTPVITPFSYISLLHQRNAADRSLSSDLRHVVNLIIAPIRHRRAVFKKRGT